MKATLSTLSYLLLGFLISCGTDTGPEPETTPAAPTSTVASTDYDEAYRPQIHFTPAEKWMNDPNGMVYLDGEYHLFYQHYPDSSVWGPMHWGHAVSRDLVHWEQLPIALYPDSLGWIFSGSAVVDHRNTSGLGENGQPPLIAIFTYHSAPLEQAGRNDFQYQGIAYSNDRGRSWTKYAGNPVIPNENSIRDFRDPKVIWDEAHEQWLMVFAAQDRVMLWRSDNLIDWDHLSDFGQAYGNHGGVWECPDLFPMQPEGGGDTKWVMLSSINPGGPNGGSATQYFVGDFDGTTFTLDPAFERDVTDGKAVWLDYGRDNYAGVTWSDIPEEDGRRLFIGWMSNWQYARDVPTEAWRSAMTVARKLELHRTPAGYRVFSTPVRELAKLRGDGRQLAAGEYAGTVSLDSIATPATASVPEDFSGAREVRLTYLLSAQGDQPFGLELSNAAGDRYRVGYDPGNNHFFSDRRATGPNDFSSEFADKVTQAPRLATSDTLRMHLLLDRASAELFADGGSTVITDIFFPSAPFTQLRLFHDGGNGNLVAGEVYPLGSIWRGAGK